MRHGDFVGGLVIGRGDGESLLKIGESALGVFVLEELFIAGFHEFPGFGGHGEFMGGDRAGSWGVLFLRNWFEVDGHASVRADGNVDIEPDAPIAGDFDVEGVGGTLQAGETELSFLIRVLRFDVNMLGVGKIHFHILAGAELSP